MVPIFGENPIEIIVGKLFLLDFAQIVTKKLIDKKNLNIFLISSNTIQYCFFCEFLALSLDLWTLLICNPWGEKKRNSYESKISLIVCCAKTNTLYGRRHLHYTTPRNQQPTSSWHFLVWWESLIWNCILIYYWQYVVPQISL